MQGIAYMQGTRNTKDNPLPLEEDDNQRRAAQTFVATIDLIDLHLAIQEGSLKKVPK